MPRPIDPETAQRVRSNPTLWRRLLIALGLAGAVGGGVIITRDPPQDPPTRGEEPADPGTRPTDPTRPPPVDPGDPTRPPPVDPGDPTRPPPVDPGDPTRPPPVEGVVARIRVSPPTAGQHVVRVNVPVPEGFTGPLTLQDRNGALLPTQATVVTRGPKGEPRMVEVMGLASTPAGVQEFALSARDTAAPANAPVDVDLKLTTVDHNGTRYDSQDGSEVVTRSGAVVHTDEHRGYMRDPRGTALLGYILSETNFAGAGFTLCELVVHNGPVPVVGDAYFRDLRVVIPAGHVVSYLMPHPWGNTDGTLIRSNGDGKMHVMLQKQLTEFRFAVHTPQDAARAQAALRIEGFGICVPGGSLWSPQNPATPWYFPQGMPMPTVTPGMNFDSYPYDMGYGTMQNALANGLPMPTNGGANNGAAGPYHPWGGTYGGATGGGGIWQYDGLAVLLSGRVDKLHEIMAYHRMVTDRHRVALFDGKGNVQKVEALAPGWKVAAYPGQMWKNQEGPLNWGAADQTRRNQVESTGRLPGYEGYLRGFEALDFQHFSRRTSSSCALVWLVNDPIGRWQLELSAEWARMHAYETGTGWLAEATAKVQQFPGKGGPGGRAEGWERFALGAWYQAASAPQRQRMQPWFAADIAMLEKAQLPSGGWMALEWGKPAEKFPNDAVCQAIENGICAGGVQACYGATGDARYVPLLRRMGDGQWTCHWKKGSGAPYLQRAVRPKNIELPAYTAATMPAPIVTETDNWQTFALLAYSLRAGSTEAAKCVQDAFGQDPLGSMLSKPMFQLDNRAPLMAWYQLQGQN